MTFRVSLVTLYSEMFPGPLGHSLAGRALERGQWSLETVNPREFGMGKHRQVDDRPAGGGPGMILRADVMAKAIDAASWQDDPRPRLLMSARGKRLGQEDIREFSLQEGLVIVCGRFEGVDERLADARNLQEVSVGDYVLSGGEPAAIVLLDAVIRLLPEVMGNAESGAAESFETGLLEYPHYTRPQEFEGRSIPPVLTSGDHERIARWRAEKARQATRIRRPDLAKKFPHDEKKKNR